MSSKDSKFGKKKSGNKFNREKTFVSSEADILLADERQKTYKEERKVERHQRRVEAGLEDDIKEKEKEKEKVEEKLEEKEPINKYDIKKFGTAEEAEKYLYRCHTCGNDIIKGKEFCSDKCKEYVTVYNYSCKWSPDCLLCKNSKRNKKNDTDTDTDSD